MEQGVSSATRVKLCLIAVVVLAAASACSKGQQAGTGAPPPVPVLVAKVEQRNVPNQLQEIGTVEAFSTVNVKARVEGQLVAINFKEGDYVAKGQLLFNLDPRPLEAALRQAQAGLARDQAQDLQAETDEKRYAFLLKEGVGSQQQYDQAHASAGALRAKVAADRAAVETARLNFEYAGIHSPIDGRTGNLQVHLGDLIKADADTPMVVINQVQPIYVDFSIPEASLADVRRNMETRQLEVDAAIPGSQDAGEHGVLSFVDNAVDRTTGTILLKGLFQNENRRLWPGQFVSASLTLNWIENALLVPSQAVQTGQQGPFVFVVGSDMKVTTRPIVAGAPFQKDILVREGLSAGETVVTDGQLRLAAGAAVRIKTSL
jgi:membrane fusion protein, multidrug efflux system